jgi:hypothetical protein
MPHNDDWDRMMKVAQLRQEWKGPILSKPGTGLAVAGTYVDWLEAEVIKAREAKEEKEKI